MILLPSFHPENKRENKDHGNAIQEIYRQIYINDLLYPFEWFSFEPGKKELLGLLYCGLGTAEEAGEVAGKIKKVVRDNNGVVDDVQRERIKKEMGDVLWYLAGVAKELGINLGSVARDNILKLQGRRERGTIHGDGDDR